MQEEFAGSFVDSLVCVARGAKKDFDEDKLHEIHHDLSEILHDRDAQIRFEPATVEFSHFGLIELDLVGDTEIPVSVQKDMVASLEELGLEALVVEQPRSGRGGYTQASRFPIRVHDASVDREWD